MSWPVLRTTPGGAALLRNRDWLAAVGVVLCGLPLSSWGVILLGGWEVPPEPSPFALRILFWIAISPVLSWAALCFALPVTVFALSAGWGGWAVGSGIGGLAAGVSALWLGLNDPAIPVCGAVLGGAFWLALRLMRPAAVRPRAG